MDIQKNTDQAPLPDTGSVAVNFAQSPGIKALVESCQYDVQNHQQIDCEGGGDEPSTLQQQAGESQNPYEYESDVMNYKKIGREYSQDEWQAGHGHWANTDEVINQKDFPSVFEFLKTIRY